LGYQQPAPGWYPAPPPHPKGTTILVLGILGLVVFTPLGIVAWVMGHSARREMKTYPGYYGPSTNVTAGWIMGIISTGLLAVAVVVGLVALAILISVGM